MSRADKIAGTVLFGFILFISCFCAGWFLDVLLGGNALIGCAAGAALGVAVNLLFLKRLVAGMFSLHPVLLTLFFLLYSVGIFGFFMGVPVFNVIMGVAAGWYAGRRAKAAGADVKRPLRNAVWLSTAVLAAFCAASAWLALNDATTAANLEGMLGLPFRVTAGMLWGIVLAGGAALLLVQALAVRLAAKAALRLR